MKNLTLLYSSMFLITFCGVAQAKNILVIPVENKSECTSEENLQLFKNIEKEQDVIVECQYIHGHLYNENPEAPRDISDILQSTLATNSTLQSTATVGLSSSQFPVKTSSKPQVSPSDNQSFFRKIINFFSLKTNENLRSIEDEIISYDAISNEPFKPFNINPDTRYDLVTTYFSTDRNYVGHLSDSNTPYKDFNNDIYQGKSKYLLGHAIVSIPKSKKIGVSSEKGFLGLDSKNQNDYTILMENKILSSDAFFYKINQNPNKKSFILLHGYNVSFSAAAIQTAELAYDLKFSGTPIFYSWPSKAKLTGYFADRKTIKASQPKFGAFVTNYLEHAPQDLYLIAHSMGSEILIDTLKKELPKNTLLQKNLKGIIFVASDVSTKKFNKIINNISQFNIPVTLYGSKKDLALNLSRVISSQQRAGFLDPINTILTTKGLEVIDATHIKVDFLGHALSPMSRDISELIADKPQAKLRSEITEILYEDKVYYELRNK